MLSLDMHWLMFLSFNNKSKEIKYIQRKFAVPLLYFMCNVGQSLMFIYIHIFSYYGKNYLKITVVNDCLFYFIFSPTIPSDSSFKIWKDLNIQTDDAYQPHPHQSFTFPVDKLYKSKTITTVTYNQHLTPSMVMCRGQGWLNELGSWIT